MDASTYTAIKRTKLSYLSHVANNYALDRGCIEQTNIKSGSLDVPDLLTGAKYTSCDDTTCAKIAACGRRPLTEGNGSAYYSGTPTAYLRIANDPDFQMGIEDFTVEWYQYLMPGAQSARMFSMGTFPFAEFAISVESGNVYLWAGGDIYFLGSVDMRNRWLHMALVRHNGFITMYGNGQALAAPINKPYNFQNSSLDLIIGSEIPTFDPGNTFFTGYLTNFHWVKGTALYLTNFTPPTSPILPVADSKLLLDMIGNQIPEDTSGKNKSVAVYNLSWSTNSPYEPFAGVPFEV